MVKAKSVGPWDEALKMEVIPNEQRKSNWKYSLMNHTSRMMWANWISLNDHTAKHIRKLKIYKTKSYFLQTLKWFARYFVTICVIKSWTKLNSPSRTTGNLPDHSVDDERTKSTPSWWGKLATWARMHFHVPPPMNLWIVHWCWSFELNRIVRKAFHHHHRHHFPTTTTTTASIVFQVDQNCTHSPWWAWTWPTIDGPHFCWPYHIPGQRSVFTKKRKKPEIILLIIFNWTETFLTINSISTWIILVVRRNYYKKPKECTIALPLPILGDVWSLKMFACVNFSWCRSFWIWSMNSTSNYSWTQLVWNDCVPMTKERELLESYIIRFTHGTNHHRMNEYKSIERGHVSSYVYDDPRHVPLGTNATC